MSDRCVRPILLSGLNLHPYKLKTVRSLSNRVKDVRLQLCSHYLGILTENTDFPNNLLISDQTHFPLFRTATISITFGTGQLKIRTNFTNVPFMTQKLLVQRCQWTLLLCG
jgi:hypothetical protein